MRRLFRFEGLNPNRFQWRNLLQVLNPLSWDVWSMLLIPVAGFIVAAYVASLWAIHFIAEGAWLNLLATICISVFVTFAAWLRYVSAAYMLAIVVGIGWAALEMGCLDLFFP